MPNPINDAEAYGVRILPVEVTPGESYWQVTSVHHRTPEENGGKHHLYFDVLDEGGARLFGARVLIRWDGGSQEVAIEKPLSEPGANFPMWKWQICNAQALGLPSDRVENLHTGHDDEPPGNTLFHHSFDITFRRAVKETTAPPRQSVIQGRMPGGAGQTLVLSTDATEIAQTQVAADERFRFAELAAGRYTIRAAAAGRQIGPVAVDGWETVEIDFPQPPLEKPLRRYLLLAAPELAATQVQLSLLADYAATQGLAFGFSAADAAQAGHVTLVGEQPDAVWQALRAAGCQVDQLPGQPGALLAAIRQ